MLLLFQSLAQADATAERIQLIVIGLMTVAAGLALLTAWYWRVTDPRRRADPQPEVPPSEADRFVPVESRIEPVETDADSEGPGGQGTSGGYELVETGDVVIRPATAQPMDGQSTGEDGSRPVAVEPEAAHANQTLDLRDGAVPSLDPLPVRPDGQKRRIGLPEPTEPLNLDLREPARQQTDSGQGVPVEDLIDLTTPVEPARARVSDSGGLSVDEWLALDGE